MEKDKICIVHHGGAAIKWDTLVASYLDSLSDPLTVHSRITWQSVAHIW